MGLGSINSSAAAAQFQSGASMLPHTPTLLLILYSPELLSKVPPEAHNKDFSNIKVLKVPSMKSSMNVAKVGKVAKIAEPLETGYNNSCLYTGGGRGGGLNREGPREFDCARFVVESTDRIWNMYRGTGPCIA